MSLPPDEAPRGSGSGNGAPHGPHPAGGARPPAPAAEETRAAASALLRRTLAGGPPAGPHLTVRHPGGGEELLPLTEEVVVGRGQGSDLSLPDLVTSRRHARLAVGPDGRATVEDLGSKNGVRLNGARLPPGPAPLRPGDQLHIGETELHFEDPTEALLGPEVSADDGGASQDGPAGGDGADGAEGASLAVGGAGADPATAAHASRRPGAGSLLLTAGALLLACGAAALAAWPI